MQGLLAEVSGFLFPSVLECRNKRELAFTPAVMTTNLQTHLREAGMKDILAVHDALLPRRSGESKLV